MLARRIIFIISFLVLSFYSFGQLPGYYFYKVLTIQGTKVLGPGSHTNFPVLIKHTDFDIRHTTSGGDVRNINGWDIRFTAADGVTLLDHQLESYNPVTGEIVAWVRIPGLASAVNTDIRMYYSNSSVSTDPSVTSTWNSKYKAVWHLHSDFLDATSNAHTMTNSGSTNQSPCIAADGQNFAASQSLNRALDATLQLKADLTMEGWIRNTTLQATTYDNAIFTTGAGGESANANYCFSLSIDPDKRIRSWWENGSGVDNIVTSTVPSTLTTGTWIYITAVRNSTTKTMTFYTDGDPLGTAVTYTNNPTGGTNSVFRIAMDPASTTRDFIGDLDELRLSDTIRSAAWIKTNYNTMFSPSTFYTLGPEYNACAVAPSVANAGPDQTICASSATLAGNTPTSGFGSWTVIAGPGSVTTPGSPTSGVTGLSPGINTFRWTISNGAACTPTTDDVTIFVDPLPTTSAAGPDQSVCITTATLAGNVPATGTGTWTVIAGTATVTTPSSPTSGVTGLIVGVNTFRWTISNGTCPPSTDDITITLYANPTVSAAGPDQNVCATIATLAGNTPVIGAGAWTVIAGSGTVTTPGSPTSGVTGLSVGVNTFRWTISNGPCTASTDDITITSYATPTISAAGTDQSVCATTATLAGNAPTVGTGAWTLIAGAGTITTPTSPTSGVTGLGVGVNTFRWTISNGPCTASTDDVTITRSATPTTSNAGPNQNVCALTATLAGNAPAIGTGTWTLVSGTGVVTTPTSPTSGVTGLGVGANVFRWTISNGSCPPSIDDITITRFAPPTTSNAGPDQNVCATTATLAGNTPTVGTGTWTVIAGGATVTTPGSPTSGVTGLAVGANTFRWTIANAPCTSSFDNIIITRSATPTTAAAGPDQSVCAATATMAGNAPVTGTGAWTLISGSGTITTPTSPTSGITGLGVGANTFRWTISNGSCPPSTDDVIITRYTNPTPAAAGPDQNVCATTATLAGNTPVVGSGVWTVIAGSATITTPSSPTSGVTGLSVGVNTFRWTTFNGTCPSSIDDITINRIDFPTTSAAGPDQDVCGTTATLAANTPAIGTGSWTVISGTGTVTTPSSPGSGVTGLSIGVNIFRWTISNGICTPSIDDVTITRYDNPTLSAAGPDQNICDSISTLAGNTPAIGTGTWTVIAGTGTVTIPSSPTSMVTGMSAGVNTFRWTISNGACTSSSDDITITRSILPSFSSAGPDQTICSTASTLAGNSPTVGTGVWTVISGSGTVTIPSSPTSGVSGLGTGANLFLWTISNGTCPVSTDSVAITVDATPTIAAAGTDQSICADTAMLMGNTPAPGTGAWTVVTGSGIVATPSSPTSSVTGLSIGINTFRWTISNGACTPSTDDITITRYEPPTASSAGPDQNICATTATLAGNSPTVGTGIWTVITGPGSVTTPSSPTSGVSGLSTGANLFLWTISNGACPASTDSVAITADAAPTTANAGTDQSICADTATLAGNTAAAGTGTWTVVTGSGIVTTPSSPNSSVTNLSIGVNTFRWTISNGTCTPSTDDITITRYANPTVSAAGPDQNVCGTTATLAGNTPSVGTGVWTVIAGTGTITTPTSPTSGVTALSIGANTFRWTVSNGTCTSSTDDVTIVSYASPTVSSAGPDQGVCAAVATLAGNTPVVGTGTWTVITGSGTVTSPSSPTSGITGLSIGLNTFRWTISNGTCASSTDDINITAYANPTPSAAGPDQNICATTTTLAGNTPSIGTGVWTVIAGPSTVVMPTSPTSGVTGLIAGTNTFVWTISNGTCPVATDTVTISIAASPTTAAAGPDQSVCAGSATLAGNTPVVGTGTWIVVAGGATVTTPGSPTSGVTGLTIGINTFRWTISNGTCAPSMDDITITRYAMPTVSNAGPDQSVCATSATLAGNIPGTGTGMWNVVAGSGTVTTSSSPTSGITGLTVGVTTLTWTISNGACPASTDTVMITGTVLPTTAAAGPDQSVCAGSATLAGNTPVVGTGTWIVVAGGATVTTPGSPTSGVTGLTIGINTFRWTISNGTCPTSIDDITITRYAMPTVSNAGPDQSVCATSTTLAGNAPGTGTGIWSVITGSGTVITPSSPTSGITGLTVGTTTLTWTISNGACPASTDTVMITGTTLPTTAAAGSDQSVCADTSTLAGNIPVVGTGTWIVLVGGATVTTPGSPTSGVTGLTIGINTFRWTISNGTCAPSMDDITITRYAMPTVSNAGPDQSVCATSATLAGNIPGTGTGMWNVVAGSGTVITPSSPTSGITGLTVGTTTLTWTISNGACPASTDTVMITGTVLPTMAAAGPDQLVCTDSALLGGNTPVVGTGTWTVITGGATITTPASPASGVTGLSIGVNTFRWTISNGTCAPSMDDITITRYAMPTASTAGPDQSVCATSTALAGNAPGTGTGIWSVITGSGTVITPSSPTSGITGLTLGTTTLVWTISNGTCPASADTVTITMNASPTTAAAGSDQSICVDSTVITGNTPVIGTGTWTVVAGTGAITSSSSSTSAVTGLSAGANTFVWTISNGVCPASADTVTITVDSPPSIAFAGTDQSVCAASTTLAGNTPGTGTGTWSLIAGTGSLSSPSSASSGVTSMSPGTNTFLWTISSGSCPSTSDTVSITVNPSTTIADAGFDSTICMSSSTLNANTPIVGAGSWSVISGSASIGTPSAPTTAVTALSPGANIFVWTIVSASCPSSSDTVVVTVNSAPSASNAGADFSVCGSSSTLNGNIPVTGTGFWTVLSGTGSLSDPTSASSGIVGMTPGTNMFVWTISSGVCPSSPDTVSVTVNPLNTNADAGPDSTICASSSTLTGNMATVGTGMWSLVTGSGTITTPSSPVSGVTGLSPGSNIFRWTISSATCPSTTDDVEIFVDTPPGTANAGADIYTNLTSINMNGNIPVTGIGTWTLISGTGTFTNTNDPSTLVADLSVGPNIFTWTISNGSCPSSTDEMTIYVSNIDVPNGFSPNGDNINDYFEIPGLDEFKEVTLNVFNRWGNLVYSNNDYKNDWDGKNNSGSNLSDDTYYYTLKLTEEKTINGYVIIKR